VRKNNSLYSFENGVLINTLSTTQSLTTNTLYIGGGYKNNDSDVYIDEFRITK